MSNNHRANKARKTLPQLQSPTFGFQTRITAFRDRKKAKKKKKRFHITAVIQFTELLYMHDVTNLTNAHGK